MAAETTAIPVARCNGGGTDVSKLEDNMHMQGRSGSRTTKQPAAPAPIDERRFAVAADRLRLACELQRLRLLIALSSGEKNVGELCAAIDQSRAPTSHLLSFLKVGGMVEVRRAGKFNYYSLSSLGRTVLGAIATVAEADS